MVYVQPVAVFEDTGINTEVETTTLNCFVYMKEEAQQKKLQFSYVKE